MAVDRTTKPTATQKAALTASMPEPVKTEQRICFGIMWFKTEAEADVAGQIVRASGASYNGGYFHGMACGRDKGWDGVNGFAVTY